MTADGGASHVLSQRSGLVVEVTATETQAAEPSPVVRRLRSASLDAQWHHALDGVYDHCLAVISP